MRIFPRRLLSLLLCLSLLFGLASCVNVQPPAPATNTPIAPAVTPAPETPAPTPPAEPDPVPSEPTPLEPDVPAEPPLPTYTFGTPLTESEVAEDASFANVAFLGDSRTEGLQLFGGLYYGDYYWARGMTVFRVDDPEYAIFDVDGEMVTMIGALRKKAYDAVYIMVGVNELGYAVSSYEEGMAKFIDLVLETQPNAVIYLQTLPPVNEEMARKSGLGDYINNTRIAQFNDVIIRIATEKKVILLDTAEAYRNEDGILPAELASDGCHFNMNGYTRWTDYLRNHVIDAETYHYNRTLISIPTVDPTPEVDSTVQPDHEPVESISPEDPSEEVAEA